jgi:ribosome assembly protein RRB1
MKGSKFDQLKNSKKQNGTAQPNFKKKQGDSPAPMQQEVIDKNEMEFSDDYEDEWEEEDIIQEDEGFEEENEMNEEWEEDGDEELVQTPRPKDVVVPFLGTKKDLKEGEVLEVSNRAYKMLHRCATDWPCLSVDFIADGPDFSTLVKRDFSIPKKDFEYPLDLYAVGGSQADAGNQNSLYVMRFAGLSLTKYDDDEDADESFEEEEARMFFERIPLKAGTNRIRTLMHMPIAILMNDNAQLQVHDLRSSYEALKSRTIKDPFEVKSKSCVVKQFMLPEEGFALDISPMIIGRFACGTLDGKVHVFNPKGDGMSDIIQSDSAIWRTKKSIEDLQFSPNQPDVLAACSADGTVRIFDLRTPFNNISELLIQAHNTDVNVISWNKKAPTLIASGAEDGSFKVWDLRYIGKPAITNIAWHQEQVCSIEWQPHDEWTLAVASADNRLSVWDFSVEKDDEETLDPNFEHVPDQLLFLHQGQEDLKEVRWHPVYPNVLMTTALDGYNVFEPAIDEADSEVESPNDLELIPDPIEQ